MNPAFFLGALAFLIVGVLTSDKGRATIKEIVREAPRKPRATARKKRTETPKPEAPTVEPDDKNGDSDGGDGVGNDDAVGDSD